MPECLDASRARPWRLRGVPTPQRVRMNNPQIAPCRVDEEPLEDVGPASKVDPAEPTRP